MPRPALLPVLLSFLPIAPDGRAAEDLEARIRQAEMLNVTAPRERSQAVLDALAPELGRATPDQRARVTFLAARNLALAGDYEAAAARAAEIHDADVAAETRLRALRLSANIELQRDRFEGAYGHLRRALALVPEVAAPEPRTNLLALAAYFFGAAGDAEKAIAYGRQALEVAATMDQPRGRCIAYHDLAVAFQDADRLDEALEKRREALAACTAAGDPVHAGVSRIGLGFLRHQTEPTPEALAMIRAGLEEVEAAGYRDGVLLGRVRLGQALAAAGRADEAEGVLAPLVGDLRRHELWRNLERAHATLAQILAGRGDFRGAMEQLQASHAAGEARFDRERAIRVAYLQADFDVRRKEQEIALLRKNNALLRLEEQTQRQRRYLAFGGAGAMTIIALLLLARSRSERRRLLWQTRHDGLTALLNHTAFFTAADEALATSRRRDEPFWLLLADIDLFKEINDLHGHAAGDAALRRVGRVLRDVFAGGGPIGRIGGEEFGIALAGRGRDAVLAEIQRFKDALRSAAGAGPAVTLSFGVAEARPGESLERMRERADLALYEAKRCGRNRIVDAATVATLPDTPYAGA